jgi:hypothetical protein
VTLEDEMYDRIRQDPTLLGKDGSLVMVKRLPTILRVMPVSPVTVTVGPETVIVAAVPVVVSVPEAEL